MPRKLAARWSRPAERDFDRTHAYWMEQSPRTAARFARAVLNAVRRTQEFLHTGTPLREFGESPLYRAVGAIWYYRVVYKVEYDVVVIVRVWDARGEPDTLLPEDRTPE